MVLEITASVFGFPKVQLQSSCILNMLETCDRGEGTGTKVKIPAYMIMLG